MFARKTNILDLAISPLNLCLRAEDFVGKAEEIALKIATTKYLHVMTKFLKRVSDAQRLGFISFLSRKRRSIETFTKQLLTTVMSLSGTYMLAEWSDLLTC